MAKKTKDTIDFDPKTNHDAISLVKQPDGNWKGYMTKHGKFIEVRQSDPNTVLQLLITHE